MASEKSVFVEAALCKFLRHHSLEEQIDSIDEIVLNYVLSILEELGEGDGLEETLDVDQFIEVMDAYVPGFADIQSVEVYDWMFELGNQLSQPLETLNIGLASYQLNSEEDQTSKHPSVSKTETGQDLKTDQGGVASSSVGGGKSSKCVPSIGEATELVKRDETQMTQPSTSKGGAKSSKRGVKASKMGGQVSVDGAKTRGGATASQGVTASKGGATASHGGATSSVGKTNTTHFNHKQQKELDSAGESERSTSESSDDIDSQIGLLIDMFPSTLRVELEHCYSVAEGDLERAAQIILYRQENDAAIKTTVQTKVKKRSPDYEPEDTKKTKELLVSRYAYIDEEEDKKIHKPVAPKAEPKKLVRYLDNQVVNTKGNRFTELKKENTEEMKKTYINLKPAKQYRFH